MPYTQKEEDLGEYNTSVQVSDDQVALVPEMPSLLQVNMPFLQFYNPDVLIENPRDDVVYLVAKFGGNLALVLVPIVQGVDGEILDARASPRRKRR